MHLNFVQSFAPSLKNANAPQGPRMQSGAGQQECNSTLLGLTNGCQPMKQVLLYQCATPAWRIGRQ